LQQFQRRENMVDTVFEGCEPESRKGSESDGVMNTAQSKEEEEQNLFWETDKTRHLANGIDEFLWRMGLSALEYNGREVVGGQRQ
jgi:hypothetical protein